jgi:serine/threonine protein kinase/tetratricopeptide (TPR) repeat protein/TolB-like protein
MNVGHTVSHYSILERIGQGGMGTVYRARDTKLGRIVAIKVLPPGIGSDDEQRERFMQEARAASALDHPNIGSVFEIDESPDGELFIAMAYYDGKNLRDRIKEGPLGPEECARIGSQIARGMSEAHARGIIHRDIKPANVIITGQGLAKIIDFGLAKLADGLQLTRTGTSLGTLAYMSPEQLRGEEIGTETDIWALGIILFEMLTGKHPFHGEFEAALMYSIANEPPLTLATFRSDIPPALDTLIHRMLTKNRAERPSTMGDVAEILERFLRGESGDGLSIAGAGTPAAGASSSTSSGAGPSGTVTAAPPFSAGSATRFLRRRPVKIIVSTVVFTVSVALYVLFRPAPGPTTRPAAPSIAVVPFAVSGEEDLRYLGEGMASEIAGVLSTSELVVISRTSAAVFSRRTVGDPTVAESLGVRYVLRGSIRVTVAQIFYDIHLYDHSNGDVILSWNSTVSRKDVIGFPGAIGSDVARQIGIDLPHGTVKPATLSPAAYESYLQGAFHRDQLKKEDIELSLVYFREAIDQDSAFLGSKLGYASTLVEGHSQGYLPSESAVTEAETLCRNILSIDSLNDGALAILGKVLDMKGDRAGGIRSLSRALEINPENDYALTALAQFYITELNEPVKGIVLLRRLKQIDPLNWLTNLNLGVAYAQSKNYTEALVAFRQAADQNPKHPWPVYSLGYLQEILGQLDSAAVSYAMAIILNPTDPKAYASLISLDIAMGRFRQADSLALIALTMNPGDYTFLYLRGVSMLLGNRVTEAGKVLDGGYRLILTRVQKEPESIEYTVYRGLFASRLGRTAEAVAAAEQAARLDSTHEETAISIARIYAATGRKGQAIAWFSRARAMNPEYNEAYLATALDFERLRRDPDLLLAAKR